MKRLFLFFFSLLLYGGEWFYYSNGHQEPLSPLPSPIRSSNLSLFETQNGHIIGATKEIILKPKDKTCFNKIIKDYKKITSLADGSLIIKSTDIKKSFSLANSLYEQGCVLYAHPNFLLFPTKRSFDPLFIQQWNFHNYGQYNITPNVDINLYEAWQYATGKGVKVAIIDNGFDFAHPDLQNAFVFQRDLVDFDDNASYNNPFERHGTACAGLIGARKNGIGIQGAAYESSLIGIKMIGSNSDGSDRALLVSTIVEAFWLAKRQGADVINCSWGTYNTVDAVRNIIEEVSTNGRNGKGTPIIFATGNDGQGQLYWANDESALESVFAIGAITDNGDLAWYSNYGPALDFVAPSGGGILAITTDDITGKFGYANGEFGHPNYCYAIDPTGFNGTSAAAPQVAGIVALMIERNPDLTRDEIYTILASTAKKIGEFPYINGKNEYFGYGLIDANAAVQEAIKRYAEKRITGKRFPIKGYFINIGPDRFDWIYITKNKVAKIAGMQPTGELLWNPILDNAFTFIEYQDPFIHFGSAKIQNALALSLSEQTIKISGYFINYGIGIYDWIYITRDGKSYKLERLSYDGSFLWIPLSLTATKEEGTIFFH